MANEPNGASARSRGRRGVPAARGASRRLAATACLAAATSFALPAVGAHAAAPKPSATEVQKKLTKLNEQVDQAVEKYNKTNEQLKIAKRKLEAARKSSRGEQTAFEQQRGKIAQMAADAYKNGDSADVTGFVASKDPQSILDQAAVFSHLSRERGSQLTQFLATAQRLRREQAQAQSAYDDVAGRLKELKDKKTALDKQVTEQKKLLQKLGVKSPSKNGGGSKGGGGTGGSYNGPASGSARVALQFAYAQLGKPYVYGASGPDSYDCSGLTMAAWNAAGVSITRTTNSQYAATKRVDRSNLQPGDLVFFNSLGHVGMYVGGGKMIHAPHTGDVVKIVDISSGYYQSGFYGAGRP